ncbi:MAG: hypothetical protein G01um101433_461 [Parcubacteria group bacterium Gr01-1014_33]|nr:MAG: hypothetical protein G01um101433_461 [Parcubacteria group bacterium Gr01-1014_33]
MNIKQKSSQYGGLKVKLAVIASTMTLSGAAMVAPFVAVADHTTEHTIQQLTAQIALLQTQLAALSASSSSSGSMMSGACSFTKDLSMGSKGDDVMCLQEYLTSTGHFTFSGGATGYFGSITKSAVSAWQAANGVSPTAGYFGAKSRAKYSMLVAQAPTPTPPTPGTPGTPPPPVPVGSGLTIAAAADQPAAALAPLGATRVPFTKFTVTASADGDVTLKSVTVERQGLADDDAFQNVMMLDQDGFQIGTTKTLNSLHQAVLNEAVVIKAGTTQTFMVGVTTLATAASPSNSGQVGRFSVVAADAGTAKVNASFPIVGNGMTINESLTIGTVTMARGSIDPGSSQTKEVGTTGYTFSSIRVTAGSAEKVYLKGMRWNQTGSVGKGDIANVKTYVDSTAYDATVSSDGKYYVASFNDNGGKGLLIDKGFSKDLSIKGDIVGGSNRTIDFDVAKRSDIVVTGENYGYGILAPQTGTSNPTDDTAAFSSVEDPWYDAAQVEVSTGTMTVSTSSTVPAQNIAINVPNQPLGAFTVDVKGEEISVGKIAFNVSLGTEGADGDVNDLTNVTLVDANGSVVAGPVDGSASDSTDTAGSGDGVITFSSTVTFSTGINTYKLLGKVGTDITNNVTIEASTTPSSDFGTVKGVTTGNTITPSPTTAITMSRMTVKAGALTISVSTVPIAQTVVANTKAFLFANYILDVTASGEDVRLTTIPLEYNVGAGGTAGNLTNCQLYDGANSLTTGGNVKNPTAVASSSTFTFDGSGLILTKGGSKTVALKCDVAGGTTGTYEWGLDGTVDDTASTFTGATGQTSAQTIVEVTNDSEGQLMTAASGGSLSVVLDSSSPGYKVVNAGSTNVELTRLRYTAVNEDIDVSQVALQLGTVASNTPIDLVGRKVTLWDATSGLQVAEAIFSQTTATADYATSSTITSGKFRVQVGVPRILIVKGDIAAITAVGPLTSSGDRLIVDYDGGNTGLTGNYGTGISSGTTISPSGADTAANPVRIFKNYPKFAYVALSSSDRSLVAGTTADKRLYRFSVEAVGGEVALYKFTFGVSSSTAPAGAAGATTSLFSLYSYTDSGYSSPDTTFDSEGQLNYGQCFNGRLSTAAGAVNGTGQPLEIYMEKDQSACNTATTTYSVPAGATRYFELRATVATVEGITGSESFTVQLEGDAAFPTGHIEGLGTNTSEMGKRGRPTAGGAGTSWTNAVFTVLGVDNASNDDFIWSPISTTSTITVEDFDYTNGYLIPGLPTSNMTAETFTSPS